jgi:hypothetical protein
VAGEHPVEAPPRGTKLTGVHRRQVTIPEDRYLLYYTFDPAETEPREGTAREAEAARKERYV